MANYDELITILKELLLNRFAPKPNYVRGLLGDGQGNVVIEDRPDYCLVRPNRGSTKTFEIFNKEVNPVDGWPILIGEFPWQPGLTQVVGTDWSAYEQTGWGESVANVPPHAPTHEWPDGLPGSDPMNVYPRALTPGRAYVQTTGSTTIFVNAFEYEYKNTGTFWAGYPGISLSGVSSGMLTGTALLMGIYFDPDTGALATVSGSTVPYSQAIDPPRPQFPAGVIPISYMKTYAYQPGYSENDFRDARRWLSAEQVSGQAGGDLTGAYPDPRVAGLFGYSLVNDAPSEGAALIFSGSAWRPIGGIGGDLTGTYLDPRVAGLFGYSLVNDAPGEGDVLMFSGSAWRPVTPSIDNSIVDGRLTLTSGTPVTTSDVTGSTVYFTPFRGNRIILYDGSEWQKITFSEVSISVPNYTWRAVDIFGYLSSGALALEAVAWNLPLNVTISGATNAQPIRISTSGAHGLSTGDIVRLSNATGNTAANGVWSVTVATSTAFDLDYSQGNGIYTGSGHVWQLNTTRATALTTQDGVLVKSGDATRRYLGTILTNGTLAQTEDSDQHRFVFNYYNQRAKPVVAQINSSHTYNSTTRRRWDADGEYYCAFFQGIIENGIFIADYTSVDNTSSGSLPIVELGLNESLLTAAAHDQAGFVPLEFNLTATPSEGFNFLSVVQRGVASGTDWSRNDLFSLASV